MKPGIWKWQCFSPAVLLMEVYTVAFWDRLSTKIMHLIEHSGIAVGAQIWKKKRRIFGLNLSQQIKGFYAAICALHGPGQE